MCFSVQYRFATSNDAEQMAYVNYHSWLETYTGMIDQTFLDSLTLANYVKKWEQILSPSNTQSFTIVAIVDEKIVGYASGMPVFEPFQNFDGYLGALYLLKAHHHKGIGKALFLQTVLDLNKRGFKSLCLHVLAQNPAVKFYRKFLPNFEETSKDKIGEKKYDEIALGWTDINYLTKIAQSSNPKSIHQKS
jgi:ribosomal protein S18 acetylase RimI-like enzyme